MVTRRAVRGGAGGGGSGGDGAAGGTIIIAASDGDIGDNRINANGGSGGSGGAGGTGGRGSGCGSQSRGGNGGSGAAGISGESGRVILFSNNVGGSSTPGFNRLDPGLISGDATANGYGVFYIGRVNTTNADLAENYPIASTELEAGDVVSLASNGTGSGAWLEKADRNANSAIAGVISTAPGVTLGSNLKPSLKAAQRPLALAGRVPVKVNLEGGVITPGDLLALSDEPGIARRAQPSDAQTLGVALSAFDGAHGDTEGVVTVLVQNRGR